MDAWIRIASLVRAHGVHGGAKLWLDTDFPQQRCAPGQQLYLTHAQQGTLLTSVRSAQRPVKNTIIVTLDALATRGDVERWIGADVSIPAAAQHALPEHEYYFHEIVGCSVVTEEGVHIGVVDHILCPGANDVWVVRMEDGVLAYVPYIADVVRAVDVQRKCVTVSLMEGIIP
jgi:16S rRNA processing protein RimM